ncbi:MAG: YncE family protein [Pseudomonadota bacterium]|nr:YncE family protein [Pseudomonadota bacterium]
MKKYMSLLIFPVGLFAFYEIASTQTSATREERLSVQENAPLLRQGSGVVPNTPEFLEQFPTTERDQLVGSIESFDDLLKNWQRRAKTGSVMHSYEVQEIALFEPGEPKFEPQPGKTYFYENLGTTTNFYSAGRKTVGAESSQVSVGDAETKEMIAAYELSPELRSSVHTTVVSPDGKFVYIVGAFSSDDASSAGLNAIASLVKIDALTLQPVKQMTIGGRMHHGQIFQDRYLLIDTFAREEIGLDVFLFDPETDEVIGGIRGEDLGGNTYTSYTDNEYIYILMEPVGYGPMALSGFIGAVNLSRGVLTTLRPYWVAQIDPATWEVVNEYPYPGYRGDWILIDNQSENIYVPAAGSSSLTKINLGTGAIEWHRATGIGPYGATFNADQSEIWVADKGEANEFFGRTVTVFDTGDGRHLDTLFSGYVVDHILLAPNGKEIWATANGDGQIFVFDAQTRQQTHVIDMPKWGDPHGLVWVHYNEDGVARVVRDQGGFHGGVNPFTGRSMDY